MRIIDHTNEDWDRRYQRHGRTNGAATYGREILEYHIPVWQKVAPANTLISTVAMITDRRRYKALRPTPLFVQYLHRFRYDDILADVKRVTGEFRSSKVVFVVAYKQYADYLIKHGYSAIWLPMTIDADRVRSHAGPRDLATDRIAYFGNLLHGKETLHAGLIQNLRSAGFQVDTFADNQKNDGPKMTQEEIWYEISRYHYGVGVGRCALEMYALGLRVLLIGGQFGGIVMNQQDFERQLETNLNGRVITYDRTLEVCLSALPKSATITSDIKDRLPFIENQIAGFFI